MENGQSNSQETASPQADNSRCGSHGGHSAITNGRLLLGVDARSPWIKRCRDLIDLHLADLGGIENCSAAEQALIRRVAVLIVELERLETRFATEGHASDKSLDLYQRMAGSLRRLLETTGLRRRARDVSPPQSLTDIAREYVHVDHEPTNID
jgi:hypothetical protein